MLKPGDEVGSWVVERPLGDGGFASVWLVRHRILHSLHALKLLDPQWLVHEKMRERFLAEGRILAQLRHPNLVAVTDVLFEYPERVGLVMEFVEGKPLDRMIEAGPLPRDLALTILAGVLAGIAHAHGRGVVHRDLKPPNIIVVDDHGRPRPVILDFGIAKVLDDAELMASGSSKTRVAARMGTPEYMSPEQIASSASVDARSDVWALGVILHEMLVGAPPFAAQTPDAIYQAVLTTTYEPAPTLDDAVARVLRGAIQRDPGKRFASAQEMLQAVLEAQGVDAAAAARVSAPASPSRARAEGTMTAADLDRRTQPEPTSTQAPSRSALTAVPEAAPAPPLPTPPSPMLGSSPTIAPPHVAQPTLAPPAPREGRSLLIGAMGGALISGLLLCTGVTTLGWAWSAGLLGGRTTTPTTPPPTEVVPVAPPTPATPAQADPQPAPATPPAAVPATPPPPAAPTVQPPTTAPIEVKPTPAHHTTPSTPTPQPPAPVTPTPTPSPTPPPVTPSTSDAKIIEDAWARYSGSLRACTRTAGPPRASTWKIKLDIKADGRLRSADASGSPPDADLEACLESTLRTKVAFGPLQAPQQRVFTLTLPPRGAPPARPPQ